MTNSTTDKPIIFTLPGNEELAENLVNQLNGSLGEMVVRHFPDGESYVRILSEVKGRPVILVCTLYHPDDKLLPLYFLTRTAKDLGASNVSLITPYLAYMRQDKQFHEGEAVSADYFGELVSDFMDGIITIDPHLHRKHDLSEVYSIPSCVAHASGLISAWIKSNVQNPVLVGPDEESEQWVSEVAKGAEAPFIVLKKERHGDRDVEVSVPDVEVYKGHTPVLVDDIISTARTMIETVGHLKDAGMKPPVCIGVHAVFAGNAYQDLLNAGTNKVITCNTIAHESNRIDVSSLLAEGYRKLMEE